MRIAYYAKLTVFLILSATGGLFGAVLGAVASFFLAPFVVSTVETVSYSPTLPLSVALCIGYGVVITSFIWSFVRSYTILVTTFW